MSKTSKRLISGLVALTVLAVVGLTVVLVVGEFSNWVFIAVIPAFIAEMVVSALLKKKYGEE